MACCAFAILLVTQLLAPLRGLLARLGLARAPAPDAAVLWQPGTVTPPVPSRRPFLIAFLAADAAIVALLAWPAAAVLPSLCRGLVGG